MGRFGALDGLIMLGLQLVCVMGALWLPARLSSSTAAGGYDLGLKTGGTAGYPLPRLLLVILFSFVTAFIAHIIVLNLLKHGWPAGFAEPWIKRPLVALAWGAATAGGIRLALRPLPSCRVLIFSALGGAAAYIIFALWRA